MRRDELEMIRTLEFPKPSVFQKSIRWGLVFDQNSFLAEIGVAVGSPVYGAGCEVRFQTTALGLALGLHLTGMEWRREKGVPVLFASSGKYLYPLK